MLIIAWRAILFSLIENQPDTQVVVRPHEIAGLGFDLLVVKSQGEGKKYLLEGFWSDPDASLDVGLAEVVQNYQLTRKHCTMVLPHSSYAHFTLNKPNIPHHEIRASLPWIAQDRLKAASFHSPVLDACLASRSLIGKEKNKMHVFAAEDSHVRRCIQSVRSAGLKVDVVTVHELAMAAFLRDWSTDALLGYIVIDSTHACSLVMVLNGDFVAYKNLPSIKLGVAVEVQKDQFTLFWSEVARHFQYYISCLEKRPATVFYITGEGAKKLNKQALFKECFQEKFAEKTALKTIDLTQVLESEGVDNSTWNMIQHDLVGGAFLYG